MLSVVRITGLIPQNTSCPEGLLAIRSPGTFRNGRDQNRIGRFDKQVSPPGRLYHWTTELHPAKKQRLSPVREGDLWAHRHTVMKIIVLVLSFLSPLGYQNTGSQVFLPFIQQSRKTSLVYLTNSRGFKKMYPKVPQNNTARSYHPIVNLMVDKLPPPSLIHNIQLAFKILHS